MFSRSSSREELKINTFPNSLYSNRKTNKPRRFLVRTNMEYSLMSLLILIRPLPVRISGKQSIALRENGLQDGGVPWERAFRCFWSGKGN